LVWIGEESHEYVYGVVPPDTEAVAVPSQAVAHVTLELAVIETVNKSGSPMVTEVDVTHPLASVNVAV
jgi:hypothetical protein